MLLVSGIYATIPLFPVGMVGGFLFLSLSVNDTILATYNERDYLRLNLQSEVDRKTNELQIKSNELQKAMDILRSTQAELIQNAKLASLGTLSAGIAHEINNSLNYVNGALPALRKLLKPADSEVHAKAHKLMDVMAEGLQLTFGIIKSLRNYSGMNQAKFNDIELQKLFTSTLRILHSKVKDNIRVNINVHDDVKIFGNVVSLNQVFMNLIVNAIDAMPNGGDLNISAEPRGKNVAIEISDNGTGIDEDHLTRIFDPFFTTKEVGKGTGIGLHIVKSEIEKHKGQIKVTSQKNFGTTFTIVLPISGAIEEEAA
jgi:C4-dicarboxylate-specific signal transduction histidine kinase